MTSNKRMLLLMLLGLAALVITGCSGGGDEEPSTDPTATQRAEANPTATTKPSSSGGAGSGGDAEMGTLEVRVTDAPDPSITAVYVTTSEIAVSSSGVGWQTVISEEITFELLALEGVEAVLGSAELAVGKYTQVRLSVPEVQIEKDGELVTAEVPSDTIKLVGNFELKADEKTFISLDFEVDKSLVDRKSNGFLFKPVIKLAVGEPGEEGSPAVALTGKPAPTEVPEPTKAPPAAKPTQAPAAPTAVPATATPAPPTATPAPPTATPDAVGAFFLDILEPVDGEAVVSVNTYDVIGRTSVDALVTVNDEFAEIAVDGSFTVTITLEEGPNIVEVVGSTAAGDESSEVLVIIFDPAA